MNAIAKHPQLEDLPRTPASDVKKLGWRGVMETVHREGKVVVTNHNRPEAVILPAAEYERLLQLLHEAGKAERDVLAQLGDKYRKRLEVLQTPQARDTLRNVLRTPLQLHGKVSAGDY